LLLEAMFQKYHFDFRGYAMASLKRRLKRARDDLGFATTSAMQDRLLHDSAMLPKLVGYLTVQVSEMFRDPAYFRTIRERVVPHLRTYPSLKVWIAGCSAGEELYSFAILFREEGLEDRTMFYATDVNQDALTRAETGIYELDRIKILRRTIASQAESRLCQTITLPRMAALPLAGAFVSVWCFPTTAW